MGALIEQRITELEIDRRRVCNSLSCSEEELQLMLSHRSLNSNVILKLSVLLEYDFFRIYSQYLILYAPPASPDKESAKLVKSSLPRYRKNIYTKEIVEFILEQINSGTMSNRQVIDEYRIPKTTLYKWLHKYNKGKN
ncbi:hypothetical protein MUU74_17755 [Chryseobacterium daecheongense]|uniref:transposase n=1 Tax=Chryseobacterium daecheongense TaxID=192389 RepID=UPI001FD6CEFB|nr:transposase [Chryseobacterium daecheongense]UOU98323.1 hypothetical protein MUU74_17755 [Chryseobacterium daecheongense]